MGRDRLAQNSPENKPEPIRTNPNPPKPPSPKPDKLNNEGNLMDDRHWILWDGG